VHDEPFMISFSGSGRSLTTFAAFGAMIKPLARMAQTLGARPLVVAGAIAMTISLGGCASAPSWLKPWTLITGDDAAKADPKLTYPNLADVPAKPTGVTPEQSRKELEAGLASDLKNAQHSSETLRNAAMAEGAVQPPDPIRPAPAIASPKAESTPPPSPSPATAAPATPVTPMAPAKAAPKAAKAAKTGKTQPALTMPEPSEAAATAQLSSGRGAVVSFAPGSAKLDASLRAKLSTLAALQKETNGRLRIIGRALGDEPIRANDATTKIIRLFDLSLRRAQAVAAELEAMGVPAQALLVEGKGADDKAARTVAVTLE
jgi:outer membrane protein OmpA-like peptidoglycan-associated protein